MGRFDAISFTSAGGYPVNEDSVKIVRDIEDLFAAVIADGLGSHGRGDIASSAAVAAVEKSLPSGGITDETVLIACLEAANMAVLSEQEPGIPMKSTAVILAAENGQASFAHVGDSRGYLFRNGHIIQQTMDHSVSQMAVLRGEITSAQIRFHESRSMLMRALGADDSAHGEVTSLGQIQDGDAFLLCTDGFWEYVTEDEMAVDLLKSDDSSAWLSYMLARIGGRVEEGHDNLSAICIIYYAAGVS